jgi:hypothetical protein
VSPKQARSASANGHPTPPRGIPSAKARMQKSDPKTAALPPSGGSGAETKTDAAAPSTPPRVVLPGGPAPKYDTASAPAAGATSPATEPAKAPETPAPSGIPPMQGLE